MEIVQKNSNSLFVFFVRYLITFCVCNLLVVAVLVFVYLCGLQSGIIMPANYAEKALQEAKPQLESSDPFDVDSIPFTCTYALFDHNATFVEGTMQESHVAEAARILTGGAQTVLDLYFLAERSDGYCLIRYDITPHFASPTLHRLIPNPELLLLIAFLLSFILLTIVTAMKFGKKLKIQLEPLFMATNAIKKQDLMFEIIPTKVKEFNKVLTSIDDMRIALKTSLEQQWNEEQNRRTQMAALTHDIKTPLTLVKGNAELLLEAKLGKEPDELATTIRHSSEKIEQYVELLMDTAIVDKPSALCKEVFLLEDFILEITAQAQALCASKNISFQWDCEKLPLTFCGDRTLLFRGIMNILDNAVNYSPINGEIILSIKQSEKMLKFIVTDNGKGFSAASLKQATLQFYTEQQERSGVHYGMGLFLAKSVADKHSGQLILSNNTSGRGAIVTLTVYDSNAPLKP